MHATKDGSVKTRIMHNANLSFTQLKEYLPFLLNMNLLKRSIKNRKTIYKTTTKGFKFLENYEEISNLLRTPL